MDISFLPKVVSDIDINQPVVLPTLFLSPSMLLECKLHSLNVKRALAFYLHRTKHIRRSPPLLLCYHRPCKGAPASSQSVYRRIVQLIQLAYQLTNKPVLDGLKAHSTRAVSTSTALFKGVQIQNIYRAATWANPLTFARHYRLDVRAKNDAAFGLSSLIL